MNYKEELELIKSSIDFLIENNIEQECVEYETEQIHDCFERLIKVIEPYYIEQKELSE